MKKILTAILCFCFLIGCKAQDEGKLNFIEDNVIHSTSITPSTQFREDLPPEYNEILSQYAIIVKSWSSDNGHEGYFNFTADFENGILPYPNGSEHYEWDAMLIDGKYPKFSKYGYVIKDINNDNIPELFWVYDDYTLLAAFTIFDGKAVTIGAYRPKARGFVLDSGEIYQYLSGGSDVYECIISTLPSYSMQLETVKHVGRYQDESFYEFVDGQEISISETDFNAFLQQNPILFEPTESWKQNVLYPVN